MSHHTSGTISLIGFDSTWTNSAKSPGAVCVIRIDSDGRRALVPLTLVSLDEALATIAAEEAFSALRIVALDPPTTVPNLISLQPVDRIAASLISWLGGGVQLANCSKLGMFDDAAPVWRFKERLGAVENPEESRSATTRLFLMKVYPALALVGPRCNPARRKTFTVGGW